jgi:glycosyltransferase involved in cell wall biosynthesis
MIHSKEISIVIPAFNEEKAIEEVILSLKHKIPESEIIVVNDGSEDQTEQIAKNAGAIVLNNDTNMGYGYSLRAGTLRAKREYLLFCDADGQHTVDDVLKLIEGCEEYDMVVGNRGKNSHYSAKRVLGKLVLKTFAEFLAGQKLPDFNSGRRIIKRDILLKYLHLMPDGFSFSTTTTFAMIKGKRRVKWVPINVKKRKGTSSVQQWKHGPQIMLLMLRLTILFEPLKVFLPITGFLFILSLTSFGIDMSSSGTHGITDTTVILFISTLLLFMFSLLCDQVSAVRRELHD